MYVARMCMCVCVQKLGVWLGKAWFAYVCARNMPQIRIHIDSPVRSTAHTIAR